MGGRAKGPAQALGQAYANLRQRNQFASLTSLGLLSLLYLAGEHAGAGRRRLRLGAIALALVLLALGNAASSSRTGALQWVLIVGLSLLWERNGQRLTLRWSALALGLYLVAALLLPNISSPDILGGGPSLGVLERFQENAGCGDRKVLWHNVAELIAQKPWLGWGWGGLKFAHFIHPYQGERFCEILDNAHNLPLHLAVALGLPLALLLCAAVVGAVAWAKPWRETQTARQLAWAGLAVLGLHSLLEYPLWYGPFQMAVGLCLWLLWTTRRAQPLHASPLLATVLTAGAACALPLLAYASWDYARVSQLFLPPTLRAEAYREDTLQKVRGSWLFRSEVLFAEVTTTPPTPDNAEALYAAALETLHFSPEPKVIAALLESARLLGRDNAITQRIRAQALVAYPKETEPESNPL